MVDTKLSRTDKGRNSFLGNNTEETLVNSFVVVGMLKSFMIEKEEITYDDQVAVTLILEGIQEALVMRNSINSLKPREVA